ncbi:FAD/NAD(P)-binding domain-containing protein [Agrocybe pediades]|nr:FAD/NAD(P)-binding domain-containing protein [Agrocybe pediades]
MTLPSLVSRQTKTVVVLGISYGGKKAVQTLAHGLPSGWRLVVVDRNAHAHHVFVMPRYAVVPGHDHKAFIPYKNIFHLNQPKPEYICLHAAVTSIRPDHVTLSRAFPEYGFPTPTIPFDYAIYALGSHLPPSLDLWASPSTNVVAPPAPYSGTKEEGRRWLQEKRNVIEKASSVLVVGGGALGIQFATDIKSVYPEKQVTLVHSRARLLPRFDEKMHEEVVATCKELEIELILGERLDVSSINNQSESNADVKKVVKTTTGREIEADLLLLCTGQAPNTELLKEMDRSTVNKSNGLARVTRSLQLTTSSQYLDSSSGVHPGDAAYPNIFVIGDAGDAFGAIAAGHNANQQGEIAATNILRLIKNQTSPGSEEPLLEYSPGLPSIKVSLGLTKAVFQKNGKVGVHMDGVPEMNPRRMWKMFGMPVESEEDMFL